jgi:hypothetical protein
METDIFVIIIKHAQNVIKRNVKKLKIQVKMQTASNNFLISVEDQRNPIGCRRTKLNFDLDFIDITKVKINK